MKNFYFLEHFKEKKDRNLADMGEIKIEYWDSDIYDELERNINSCFLQKQLK